MIIESAQNIIGHLKDIPNENIKIVEIYTRKLIESQQNMQQEKYEAFIKDGCKPNLYERNQTIEKLIKSAEKVEFDNESHIQIITELMWKVDESGSLIKEKDSFIKQWETKVQDFEEENHQSESQSYKSMQDIGGIKVEIRILVENFYMADNHALG